MSNLFTRTLSGAVYVAIVVSSILVHPYYFGAVFMVLSLLTVHEYMRLMRTSVIQIVLTMVLAAVLFAAYFCNGGLNTPRSTIIYGGLLAVALIIELFLRAENPIHNWGHILVSQGMLALPFALMVGIYSVDEYLLLSLFILIWVNDTGAYLVGSSTAKRASGNHKMFPRVSPNKSWEGLIGGLFFALLGGWVLYYVGWLPSCAFALVFALLISVFGTFGDLMESLMKRTIGVKDSGNLMPGHGGALDRFDSLLLAAPIIYLFLLCWQV